MSFDSWLIYAGQALMGKMLRIFDGRKRFGIEAVFGKVCEELHISEEHWDST